VWRRDEIGEEVSHDDLFEIEDNDDLLFESEDDDDSSEESRSLSKYEDGALRYYDVAYNLGCHKSFPDYYRLYVAERRINRKGATEQIVGRALSRLKKLRSIVITD
jgi:hypothetical protein